jgi:hypothetical protein
MRSIKRRSTSYAISLRSGRREMQLDILNEDISEVVLEVPEGHRHIRTRIVLQDGTEIIFREAAIANITRAFTTIKTDPLKSKVRLVGRKLVERKPGYAEWQLLEEQ